MATGKKFYWLKLSRDFFKRHDIRIIESQENGKDYILFYLKLLVESIDHEGQLRFSDTVPYDEKMLEKVIDIEDLVSTMIEKEKDYVSYKVNAGERQESIKFPAEYRDKINEVLFPEYADDMKLLHKNYEVVDEQ